MGQSQQPSLDTAASNLLGGTNQHRSELTETVKHKIEKVTRLGQRRVNKEISFNRLIKLNYLFHFLIWQSVMSLLNKMQPIKF